MWLLPTLCSAAELLSVVPCSSLLLLVVLLLVYGSGVL